MAIQPYLAMTAGELRSFSQISFPLAWMASHFSPYGLGLSNLPKTLPHGSLLLVDDITPPRGHDGKMIAEQLEDCAENFQCRGVLLDFQRKGIEETQALVNQLVQALPCPVMVPEHYAEDLSCPVFLPPVPPSAAPEEYLLPWKDREIWLEIGLEGEVITLTEEGAQTAAFPCPDFDAEGFEDDGLHCHYTIETSKKSARFTLWRTKKDLDGLLEEAERFGIAGAVGLYQELGKFTPFQSLPLVKGGTAKP